eukprot:TRINITY_DN348_c0_g1_i1.p1 TRINITY_DN348_c0_g1~~TRINITY_DN348_c0_g1_i1.p1  ORF type:complete len:234 (+),score=68.15 TRINITY_DN348_c0_g1_i1:42-743(+)
MIVGRLLCRNSKAIRRLAAAGAVVLPRRLLHHASPSTLSQFTIGRRSLSSASSTSDEEMGVKTGPIETGDVVEIAYVNRLDDGTQLDVVPKEAPVSIRVGGDDVLDGLTSSLLGKKAGDVVEIVLTPQDRGVEYDDDQVIEFEIPEEIIDEYDLEIGQYSFLPRQLLEAGEEPEPTEPLLDDTDIVACLPLEIGPADEDGFHKVKLDLNPEFYDENFNMEVTVLRNFGDVKDE